MHEIIIILVVLIILHFIIGIYHSYTKYNLQIKLYNEALTLSKQLNKPLLVIGNPLESSTNYMFGAYGCGDICIDMTGCICNENVINIKSKLEDELHNFKDESVVVFESETLEYIDDDKIDYVINELHRISGNNIFAVHQLKPNSYLTHIKSFGYSLFNKMMNKPLNKHKRLFTGCPPNSLYTF